MVRSGRSPVAAPPELQHRLLDLAAVAPQCEPAIAGSRVTTSLFLLRHAIDDLAPLETRNLRFLAAQKAVTWALSCNPLDGNLWLVAATLDRIAAYQPERFQDLLAMSVRTMPLEGAVLERRWELLAPLIGRPIVPIFNALLEADLDNFLAHAPQRKVGNVIRTLRVTGGEAIADAHLGKLTADRRAAVQLAATSSERRPKNLDQPDNFKFTPFGSD